jgi:Spy/CpxP family protein refolding chaperone
MSIARLSLGATVALALSLGACSKDAQTAPSEQSLPDQDFALMVFGEPGAALAGTLGAQPAGREVDGRRGAPDFRSELRLTEEQRAEIAALREAFRTAHQASLDEMRAIFEQARAAREAGDSREEVHAILATARPIALALREHVAALHEAILAVLTPEQQAWLRRNRPPVPPAPPSVRPPMNRPPAGR